MTFQELDTFTECEKMRCAINSFVLKISKVLEANPNKIEKKQTNK